MDQAEPQDKNIPWHKPERGNDPDMGGYVVAQTTETDANGMVKTPGHINGGFYAKTDSPSSQAPSVVISVDNMQDAIKQVKKSGGKILGSMDEKGEHTLEPQMIPGVGLWLSIQDTEGNRVSMLQANPRQASK